MTINFTYNTCALGRGKEISDANQGFHGLRCADAAVRNSSYSKFKLGDTVCGGLDRRGTGNV
jgi:hypothetical protein